MDFVNRLRHEHLSAFWYFPSKVNFALIGTFGSLLLATAPCQEEVEFYRARLDEYCWALRVSSEQAKFIGFALESLEDSTRSLADLPRRPTVAEVVMAARQDKKARRQEPPPQEITTSGAHAKLGISTQLPGGRDVDADASWSSAASPSTSASSNAANPD
jgi:hypothetical protein